MSRDSNRADTLERFLSVAAMQALRIQREHLDRTHWDAEADAGGTGSAPPNAARQLAEVLARIGADVPEIARALVPPQLILRRFEIEAAVHFRARRERRFGLEVKPLNLGFERRYGESLSNSSTIRIEVEPVPDLGSKTPNTL